MLLCSVRPLFFFFFQAEDGIRDLTVTGVQTCALPISSPGRRGKQYDARRETRDERREMIGKRRVVGAAWYPSLVPRPSSRSSHRSTEIGRASCRERV